MANGTVTQEVFLALRMFVWRGESRNTLLPPILFVSLEAGVSAAGALFSCPTEPTNNLDIDVDIPLAGTGVLNEARHDHRLHDRLLLLNMVCTFTRRILIGELRVYPAHDGGISGADRLPADNASADC